MKDSISYDQDGNATSFTGSGGVSVYAMIVIASGLKFYANPARFKIGYIPLMVTHGINPSCTVTTTPT